MIGRAGEHGFDQLDGSADARVGGSAIRLPVIPRPGVHRGLGGPVVGLPVAALARALDMPPSAAEVAQGGAAREKLVFIAGDPETLAARLKALA